MKTFSRLNLFALVFLGLAIMLIGTSVNTHAQESTLEIGGETGSSVMYQVGNTVEASFVAAIGQTPAEAVLEITNPDGAIDGLPASITTAAFDGQAVVTGTISKRAYDLPLNSDGYHEVSIVARWDAQDKNVSQEFLVAPPSGIAPAVIVVNPPVPKQDLKVGDTFKQEITIENHDPDWRTLPLSAWQMDIVYNPSILAVVSVIEGDFLESNGDDALFIANQSRGRISTGQALAGQTGGVATMPSPNGISLAPGDSEALLTIEFRLLAYAEEALGIHNTLLQSDFDHDEDGIPDRISYSIMVKDVAVATKHETYIYAKEDVNQDEMVNILDLMEVAASIGSLNPRADINGDGFVDVLDLVLIYTSDLWAKPAPKTLDKSFSRAANNPAPTINGTLDSATIQSWINHAQVKDDGSEIFKRGISNLETLLNSKVPNQTRLLMNYPNPFNPETWIPYQLSEATDVTVTIHAMNGSLIRTLNLGHQTPGSYISKSQAAYWDGRNEFGEHSASGLYFYTFTAGKFKATGKMLIVK